MNSLLHSAPLVIGNEKPVEFDSLGGGGVSGDISVAGYELSSIIGSLQINK